MYSDNRYFRLNRDDFGIDKIPNTNYLLPEIYKYQNKKWEKIQTFLFYFDSFDTSDAGEEFCWKNHLEIGEEERNWDGLKNHHVHM